MSKWKECKLGDVLKFGNGKTRPRTIGENPIYGGNGILGYTDKINYEEKRYVFCLIWNDIFLDILFALSVSLVPSFFY